MNRILVVAIACGLVAGVAAAQDAAAVERGKSVFTTAKCGLCHSIAGVGNKKGPLDGVGSKVSAADIRQWIVAAPEMAAKTKAERKPPMKAYATLSKEDLDGLVAYMQALKK